MKALIFGSQGQLGRALCETASAKIELIPLSRAQCDIQNPTRVNEAINFHRPDLVINAAAYTAVDKAESEPEVARAINAVAPGLLAQACDRWGARLIHLSTDFVFDGRSGTPYRPDDPTNPLSVYGRTKLAGEVAVHASLTDALIVRTAWVYDTKGHNFVNTMLRLMRERDEVCVVSDQFGTPTRARDLAAALWLLAGTGRGGILHYTNAGAASWYDFAVAIQEEAVACDLLSSAKSVVPIIAERYPVPAHRPHFAVLDKEETWARLGTTAMHWRGALRRTLWEMTKDV